MTLHDIPPSSVPFVGRAEEHLAIDACGPVVILHGEASNGKTHLASTYAYTRRHKFADFFWISARTESSLSASLSTIAKRGALPALLGQYPPKARLQQFIRSLNVRQSAGPNHLPRLVIVDDVSDPLLITGDLPVSTQDKVIITCRSLETIGGYGPPVQPIHVGPFTLEAASYLLDPDEGRDDLVTEISDAVGYQPLALDMVRRLMANGKKLQEVRDQILQLQAKRSPRSDLDAAAWVVSPACRLAYPASSDGDAILLLQLLACLERECPYDLFKGSTREAMLEDGPDENNLQPLETELKNPFLDPAVFDRAKNKLFDNGLIEIDDENSIIKCHDSIRIAVWEFMQNRRLVLHKAAFLLNASFPKQSNGEPLLTARNTCIKYADSLVSGFQNCIKYLDPGHQPPILLDLVCRLAWHYYEIWSLKEARDWLTEAMKLQETIENARNHPGFTTWYLRDMYAHLLNVMGVVEGRMSHHRKAHRRFQDVLRIREKNKRPGNLEDEMWIHAVRGNIAATLLELGEPERALPILQELILREDMRPNMDIYLANLVLCYELLGRYKDASAKWKECASLITTTWGETDIRMATILFYSFKISRSSDCGNPIDALQKCLEIRTQKIPMQPETAFTYYWTGTTEGDPAKAKTHLENAWTIIRLRECHPGAKCFILRKLIEVLDKVRGDSTPYTKLFEQFLKQEDVDWGMGKSPEDLERYVPVSCR